MSSLDIIVMCSKVSWVGPISERREFHPVSFETFAPQILDTYPFSEGHLLSELVIKCFSNRVNQYLNLDLTPYQRMDFCLVCDRSILDFVVCVLHCSLPRQVDGSGRFLTNPN